MTEKRSSKHGIAAPAGRTTPPVPGVGARHSPSPPQGRGGEYLNICGSWNVGSQIQPDPRFEELERIGLPKMWLRVAETVGFDLFLEVWRRLTDDAEASGYQRETGGVKMPGLRSYDAYLRYQRNRYIEGLAARGMKPPEVRRAVAKNLREPLDERHVFKIMNRR